MAFTKRSSLMQMLTDHERILIIEAVQQCGGNRSKAAEALGVSERTIFRRIKALKMDKSILGKAKLGRKLKAHLNYEPNETEELNGENVTETDD